MTTVTAKKVLLKDEFGNPIIPYTVPTAYIGQIIQVNANENYVPDGCLPCDGAEYSREQFKDFCKNYLDGEGSLNTCTYSEYEADITTYGQCSKFAVDGTSTIKTSGLSNITVSHLILNLYPNGVELEFTYNGTNWTLDGNVVNLADYHITASGTYKAGDTFKVSAGLVQKFRVPTINKVLTDIADTVDVVGDGKVLEYINGTDTFTLIDTSSNGIYPKTNAVGYNVGDEVPTSGGNLTKHYTGIGLSQNAETSGIIADTTNAKTYSELRYFVVVANGQTNQSMMDWSAWASSLQGKLNTDHSNDPYPYIKEIVTSGTDGYIVYSNGLCEQWGFVSNVGTSATINLYKEYSDIYYNKTLGATTNSANDTGGVSDVTVLQNTTDASTTTTSFNISSLSGVSVYWRTIGKLK